MCVVVCGTAHGIHVLSADGLIQEVLEAHHTGAAESEVCTDYSPVKAVCSNWGVTRGSGAGAAETSTVPHHLHCISALLTAQSEPCHERLDHTEQSPVDCCVLN